jgi:Mannose-6-phosphate isomerase
MQFLDKSRREQLLTEAAALPRLRTHELWHADHSDGVQRLILAAHPGTYFAPHCHAEQWEILTLLTGCLDLLLFATDGTVTQRHKLQAGDTVQMPAGTLHTMIIQEPVCLFEVKPGPFRPSCFVPWAPQENSAEVPEYQNWLQQASVGEKYGG